MMVIIEKEIVAQVPVLHVVKQEKKEGRLPFILFIHGFTSAKEHNLHFAYLLAEAGYRVVMPDALYHGERGTSLSGHELQLKFWHVVRQMIAEVKWIKEEMEQRRLIDPDRVGIAGTSMGGIVTFGSLAVYPWIKAAVSLMGCPAYEMFFDELVKTAKKTGVAIPLSDEQLKQEKAQLVKYDLSKQPEKLAGRPLLIWHSECDQVVPYAYTYEFYEQIKPLYQGKEKSLKFISDATAGHKVTREALLETVKWFTAHV
ncbi:prolyl oligopeptidase family serine peptidase [Parageobacillus thermoglucosidasius]|mgnify:CR=1 FL=1|nr:hypothetical protein Geoth_3096 [Parageobacillus thermoglucosidasius C56-YS93]GCD83800.1 putative esterase YitV [Parageobacillus thermoglucosidasius]GMN99498.1 prolyl oligopeptidase family serine peptidase [Parageobacillus thermoglucosidasius]